MKDCSFYIEKAIEHSRLKNRAELARLLNIKHPSLTTLQQGKTIPSDETMMKLCELSGMPKEQAFIELNIWRSRNDQKRLNVWKNISKMIKTFCLALCFSNVITPAFCQDESHTMYIMYSFKKLKSLIFKHLAKINFFLMQRFYCISNG